MMLFERIAAALIRLHGREFIAIYGDDAIETVRRRAAAARSRGVLAWIIFAILECASLVASLIRTRVGIERVDLRTDEGEEAPSIAQWTRELWLAGRRLGRAPVFATTTLLTLTVAIAALITAFALLWRLVIAPLPFPESARLISLDHAAPGAGISNAGMSIGVFREYAALPSIDAIALYSVRDVTITGTGHATRTRIIESTPAIDRLFGLQLQLGRWFLPQETEGGGVPVVVLSDAIWKERFGAAPSAIGSTLRIDGVAHQIVGVLSSASTLPDPRVRAILPLPLPAVWERAAGFNYAGVARLAGGTPIEAARRDQDAAIAQLPSRYPADREIGTMIEAGLRSTAQPLKEVIAGGSTRMIWALFGAAALILLMACANLANLFLVRHDSRLRELAVQRALGATRWNLAAQALCEATFLAGIGGALAMALTAAAIQVIAATSPVDVPRLGELRLDGVVVLFAVVTSLITALACAALPVLSIWIKTPSAFMTAERAPTSSPRSMRARHALMAVQAMVAVVLLCTAALFAQSFRNIGRVDPGFNAAAALVFEVNLPRSEYRSRADAAAFQALVLDRLAALPAVESVAAASYLPLDGAGMGDPIAVRGRVSGDGESAAMVRYRRVSHDYFDVMGIPLLSGRRFDVADRDGRTDAVIVNEALARAYFGPGDPVGQHIRPLEGDTMDRWLTIVGVVGNTVTDTLTETAPVPKLYVPLRGSMWADVPSPHDLRFVARVHGDPIASAGVIRRALADLNPGIALAGVERLEDLLSRARAYQAVTLLLLVVAGVAAAGIGTIGVYGVVAYAVSTRLVEIGVRIAIGATPRQVTAMIVRRNTIVLSAGILAGIAAAAAIATSLQSMLFGVAATDWMIHGLVGLAALTIGTLACWWPAARAARESVMRAIVRA